MIKLFIFSRQLPALSREQFHKGLLEDHAPLAKNCPGFVAQVSGYLQNHFTLQLAMTGGVQSVSEARFYNCSELYYESMDHFLASYNNDDYFRMLRPDENVRTDASTRIALLAEEKVVFEEPDFKRGRTQSKILVLNTREGASPPKPPADGDAHKASTVVRCIRKTENTILGAMDFLNAKIAENVVPEFSSITTYSLAMSEPEGSSPAAERFNVFDASKTAPQLALLARTHHIFGHAA